MSDFDVDYPPKNCEEKQVLMGIIRAQLDELPPEYFLMRVTCPKCKKQIPLYRAVRCMDCGLYFCEPCARKHFGVR